MRKRASLKPISPLLPPELAKYIGIWDDINNRCGKKLRAFQAQHSRLANVADWHLHYGLHFTASKAEWYFREWLPNATKVWLIGDFSDWKLKDDYRLFRVPNGDYERNFQRSAFTPGQRYRLFLKWPGGEGYRIPTAATQVTRDRMDISRPDIIFNAVVTIPTQIKDDIPSPPKPDTPFIYEAHPGMSAEHPGIATFASFRQDVLPRIAKDGYNVIQLMAIMQHPYYASFGYQVSNFFSVCDLFGTPDDLRALVNEAHSMGIRVTMDLVHSHAANNTVEGLSAMDGTPDLFFHKGQRGLHPQWGSRCFDYGKQQVLRFLTSNCRFWLKNFKLDGFRFDGVTSMLFKDHGIGRSTWSYDDFFGDNLDQDALIYLIIANQIIHEINPDADTVAEEVAGFPMLALPVKKGGGGFNYRLAMGVTDYWFKLTDIRDEAWSIATLWHELTYTRKHEKAISYVESHDQALVGGQTFAFRLMGADMYNHMTIGDNNLKIDRGIALHKMARLATIATAAGGYLNFMGNEFGHPDWIDFPSLQNNWSFHYARRQWSLEDNPNLKYHFLADFDKALLALFHSIPNIFTAPPQLLLIDEQHKLLAFERAKYIFIFNFHPTNSVTDFPILCLPGSYELILDTDNASFGGYDRIKPAQRFFSNAVINDKGRDHYLKVYLPCRTAIVLHQELSPDNITD